MMIRRVQQVVNAAISGSSVSLRRSLAASFISEEPVPRRNILTYPCTTIPFLDLEVHSSIFASLHSPLRLECRA
jgi:hypothetical protein